MIRRNRDGKKRKTYSFPPDNLTVASQDIQSQRRIPGRGPSTGRLGLAVALGVALTTVSALKATAASPQKIYPTYPDFGPHVFIFDPSMATSEIQAIADKIHAVQVDNEMGTDRYSLLFQPGTYGTDEEPLQILVGYNTEVAGLGASPGDVQVNGAIEVYNRCFDDPTNPEFVGCFALNNFWRSLANLTINVNTLGQGGCEASANFWAVSQAVSMRRVDVKGGTLTLMDYCTGPSFASGGFIADSRVADPRTVDQVLINGSQQQWYARNVEVTEWTNPVWNQVFSGVIGAPVPPSDPAGSPDDVYPDTPYTVLDNTPVSREKPYLFVDAKGKYNVRVPSAQFNTRGTSWSYGMTPGRTLPITRFFIAKPSDSIRRINNQLARGKHLILTPGVYDVGKSIKVKRANTVVLGMGQATLTAVDGAIPLRIADSPGIIVAGVTIDAGTVESSVLLQVGKRNRSKHRADYGEDDDREEDCREKGDGEDGDEYTYDDAKKLNPTTLSDVYFRIGGPHIGKCDIALEVNSDGVLIDHTWVWRADHGVEGFEIVGGEDGDGGDFGDHERWRTNIGRTGVVVNGDDVTATGFFVEHFQQYNTIWNGENGLVILYQNELPYDPPTQADWMTPDGTLGWAAYKVADHVENHVLWGGGSYCFNRNNPDIVTENAYEVPDTPGVKMNHVMTKNLSGPGTIEHVVNGVGDAVDGILPCAGPEDPPNCGDEKGPFEPPSYVIGYSDGESILP